MKPKKQPEKWEKRFDKKFKVYKNRTSYLGKPTSYLGLTNASKVKQFISQLRQEAIRETLGKVKIEKKKDDSWEQYQKNKNMTDEGLHDYSGKIQGYNQAVDDLNNLKNKLKEGE